MKVYIIRHGEVPHNALKQYNNENEDLTKKGIKQAEELREKIKTIDYDIIICSPLIQQLSDFGTHCVNTKLTFVLFPFSS